MDLDDFMDNDWEELEEDAFKNEIKCLRLTTKGEEYRVIGYEEIIKRIRSLQGVKTMNILANPRTYLEEGNPLMPYGFWTCKCKTKWLRTPLTSSCQKCNSSIKENTSKAKYIGEVLE